MIYLSSTSTSDIELKLNLVLANSSQWLHYNKLVLNMKKTEFMTFGTRQRLARQKCNETDISLNQFGSMPVLEEAKTMVYVTNHNMITMAMVIFKTYKMADKGEERVLTEILVYSCFIEPFICLLLTMNWEIP